ncbi:MAG: Nif3-like dinuclear metal center hexameric protein [Gemmataceae bacterium]
MLTIATLIDFLKQFAPRELAAEWDNVGLLLGDAGGEARRVMTCLTVTPDSAAEAVAENAHLIISHHPILFHPTRKLTADTAEGRLLLALARAGVAVYSPHTAFDNCQGGINDMLARRLELREVAPLRRAAGPRQCKIVVFVPDSDLSRVSDALFQAGAGVIGDYGECSFRLQGTGTFFGSDETNPTVGQKGRREEVSEWRLEVVCPEEQVGRAVAAMRQAHSYEEPAFDVYPLRPLPANVGEGRVGCLPHALPLQELARSVKDKLAAATVQYAGDPQRLVARVAIACGAGGDLLTAARHSGAEVFLTGELRFHDILAAEAAGLAVLLPGHYATERCGVEELAHLLRQRWPELHVWASRREQEPLREVVAG